MGSQADVDDLKRKLKAATTNAETAARYGNKLLKEKKEYMQQLAVLKEEKYMAEKLKQDVHSLTNKLKLKEDMEASLMSEIRDLRKENCELKEMQSKVADFNPSSDGHSYATLEKEELLAERDELKAKNNDLVQKLSVMKVEMEQERANSKESEALQGELHKAEDKAAKWQEQARDLKVMIVTLNQEQEELQRGQHEAKSRIMDLQEEVERCREMVEIYKEQNRQSQAEIESLKENVEDAKCQNYISNTRGNSVFSELNDRREEVEEKYQAMRVKYDKLLAESEELKRSAKLSRERCKTLLEMYKSSERQKTSDKLLCTRMNSIDSEITVLRTQMSRSGDERGEVKKFMEECLRAFKAEKQVYELKKKVEEVVRKVAALKSHVNEVYEDKVKVRQGGEQQKMEKMRELVTKFHVDISLPPCTSPPSHITLGDDRASGHLLTLPPPHLSHIGRQTLSVPEVAASGGRERRVVEDGRTDDNLLDARILDSVLGDRDVF